MLFCEVLSTKILAAILARVLAHVAKAQVPVILCVNKIDKLKDKQAVLPFLADIGKKYQPDDLFPLLGILYAAKNLQCFDEIRCQ
jgi:GTPase Era involved in 16S rRNA processing